MTTVIKIIEDHLRGIGADGLVYPSECVCEIGNLAPCDGSAMHCQPGWRGASKDGDDPEDWLMYASKEAADASKAEGGEA